MSRHIQRVTIGTVQFDVETGHPIEQMNPTDTIESLRAERDALRTKLAAAEKVIADRPYCPECNFPHVTLGTFQIDLTTGEFIKEPALSRTSEEGK